MSGQSWQDRLAEWLKDTGCDAWVLRSYARTAAAYASERIGRMMPYSPLTANQRFDEWMAYYRARGVEEIHGGILAMRRRSGKNWIRIEEVPSLDYTEPFGESIEELFANQDRLEADRSIDQMLAWRPRVRIGHAHRPAIAPRWPGSGSPPRCRSGGPAVFPVLWPLDPQVAEFLRQCDGSGLCPTWRQDLARGGAGSIRNRCASSAAR